MAEAPSPKSRSRGPAAGRLWSGEAGPEAPPPVFLPPDAQPTRESHIFRDPSAPDPAAATAVMERPERGERKVWSKALAGGALSGLAVAAAALAIGVPLVTDDDGGSPVTVAETPAAKSAGNAGGAIAGRVFAAASPAVAAISNGTGSGTGFLTDSDGTIVTNAHVVGGATDVRVRFGDDGRTLDGSVIGKDTSTDLAVVKVDAGAVTGIRPLALADSDKVKVGDAAIAIGNPLGLPQTATAGIVSGLGREIQAPNGFQIDEVIQTDAPINPGNSGGPLLDASAHVIGVNSQIATAGAGSGNIGIGFAVPANTARDIVPQLAKGGQIKRPWMGVSTQPAPTGGAQVAEVTSNSPASKAGLRPGDVIKKIDGKRVSTPEDVSKAVTESEIGAALSVEVQRGEGSRSLDVTLENRPR